MDVFSGQEENDDGQTASRHTSKGVRNQSHPRGLVIVAVFTILAGGAEVLTGFTHNFFGITTSSITLFTYSSAVIGVCYGAAGLLMLTMKKWAAALAMVLLGADIVGRVVLVLTGLYPTNSLRISFPSSPAPSSWPSWLSTSDGSGSPSDECKAPGSCPSEDQPLLEVRTRFITGLHASRGRIAFHRADSFPAWL